MATNQEIQSILARAILDVGSITNVENSRGSLGRKFRSTSYGTFSVADYKVLCFSAFIAKVKHNFMWSNFFFTCSLLQKYSLDITVFVEYLPFYQKYVLPFKLDNKGKQDLFISFLKSYLLARRAKKCKILYWVIIYEEIILSLKVSLQNDVPQLSCARDKSTSPIVKINGCFNICEFPFDPSSLLEFKDLKSVNIKFVSKYVYILWKDPRSQEIVIFKITKRVKVLLECIDNLSSIEQILGKCKHRLGLNSITKILNFMHDHNIIYLEYL